MVNRDVGNFHRRLAERLVTSDAIGQWGYRCFCLRRKLYWKI